MAEYPNTVKATNSQLVPKGASSLGKNMKRGSDYIAEVGKGREGVRCWIYNPRTSWQNAETHHKQHPGVTLQVFVQALD
jgi:hypothetical protein